MFATGISYFGSSKQYSKQTYDAVTYVKRRVPRASACFPTPPQNLENIYLTQHKERIQQHLGKGSQRQKFLAQALNC